MSALLRGIALALLVVPLMGASCQPRPNVPEQVDVIVEKYRDLPTWATEPLVKPAPIDGTVEARIRSEEARGVIVDLANCHRRLLTKLDNGEAVDEKECRGD